MLDISKPLTSSKVSSYYRSEYSAASNSYYTQGDQLRGEWHGQLISVLGLPNQVNAEAFDRLAEGQHPITGEQLIQHRDTIKTAQGLEVGHRAGWDLTFNAPKTVSLTALVGQDDRVRIAHQEAVRTALDETERYVQARGGGYKPAQTTGKWIAATFEHSVARPVDGYAAPHLHTHAVVFNMTEASNGQARSLQPHELFRVQAMATAVYQNALGHQLRALGYQIERGPNHAPDIKGYTSEYMAAESLRAAQIKRTMEEHGLVGREAESKVKHQGREAKLNLSPDELRAIHQRKAQDFGNQPGHVVEAAANRVVRAMAPDKAQDIAHAAVEYARLRLSERASVFEHAEVIRDAARHAHGRVPLPAIQSELDRQKQQQRFVAVEHVRPNAPMHRYTTPEAIGTEQEIIRTVLDRQTGSHPTAQVTEAAIAARFPGLNHDQRRLVRESLSTTHQIYGIQGSAGTGKTTALYAIRELATEYGYSSHGLGPTSRAAKGLKEAGIDSETLQRYLTKSPKQSDSSGPRLFFVDESSLASARQLLNFLGTVRKHDRVLLIGDTHQHQSIEAGRIFGQLQDAGMGIGSLTKIVRQKDEDLRAVVEAMARGNVRQGVDLLQEQNRVHSIEHRTERFQVIAKAYAQHPAGTLVISPDNLSRQELNTAIREEMRASGFIKPDAFTATILRTRQDLTSEDRGMAGSYRIGDHVRYLKGSQALGLKAKTYATVVAADAESNRLTVQTESGKTVTYDPARLKGVTVYNPEARPLAIGERVQFTAPWRSKAISTRDMATITELEPNGNIRVALDDSGRTIGWNLKENRHLDYAYAMTSHSSQGATVDRVLIHVDTGDNRTRALVNETLAYVALSRPRHDAQVYTDNEFNLTKALERKNENSTALSPQQTASYGMGI